MNMAHLRIRLKLWLESFGHQLKIATDSLLWDWAWFQEILTTQATWPSNVDRHPFLLTEDFLNDYEAFNQAIEQAYLSGLSRHHALDDAKANRLGWIAAGGDIDRQPGKN
jgi:hypothetical protein